MPVFRLAPMACAGIFAASMAWVMAGPNGFPVGAFAADRGLGYSAQREVDVPPTRIDLELGRASGLPGFYRHFYNGVEIYEDGEYIVVETVGTPDHTSPYWGRGHPLYEPPTPACA